MKALTHTASFKAKTNLSEALGARLLELVSPTRSEAGYLRYEVIARRMTPMPGSLSKTGVPRRTLKRTCRQPT